MMMKRVKKLNQTLARLVVDGTIVGDRIIPSILTSFAVGKGTNGCFLN
jgi:hypothetical protein